MAVEIKKVTTRKDLKRFIRFNYEFYKGNPYSVPDLYDDMLNTFSREKNAAFEFCEADYFLALRASSDAWRPSSTTGPMRNGKRSRCASAGLTSWTKPR